MPKGKKKSNARKGKSQKTDETLFNANSDSDYSIASDTADLQDSLNVQIKLRKEELQLFMKTNVEIVRFGEDELAPTLSGLVLSVDETPGRESLKLAPAVVHGQTVPSYTVALADIEAVKALSAPKYTWAELAAIKTDQPAPIRTPPKASPYSRPVSRNGPLSRPQSQAKSYAGSRPQSRANDYQMSRPQSAAKSYAGSRPASRCRSRSPTSGPTTRSESAARIRYLSGRSSASNTSVSYADMLQNGPQNEDLGEPQQDFQHEQHSDQPRDAVIATQPMQTPPATLPKPPMNENMPMNPLLQLNTSRRIDENTGLQIRYAPVRQPEENRSTISQLNNQTNELTFTSTDPDFNTQSKISYSPKSTRYIQSGKYHSWEMTSADKPHGSLSYNKEGDATFVRDDNRFRQPNSSLPHMYTGLTKNYCTFDDSLTSNTADDDGPNRHYKAVLCETDVTTDPNSTTSADRESDSRQDVRKPDLITSPAARPRSPQIVTDMKQAIIEAIDAHVPSPTVSATEREEKLHSLMEAVINLRYAAPMPPSITVSAPTASSSTGATSRPTTPWERAPLKKHTRSVRELWKKRANQLLAKEAEDAKRRKSPADFHAAFLGACASIDLSVNPAEIYGIKLGPNDNLANEQVLDRVLDSIYLCPSTQQTDTDVSDNAESNLFSTFDALTKLVAPAARLPEAPSFKINRLSSHVLDNLHLNFMWATDHRSESDFATWLKEKKVTNLIEGCQLQIANPSCYDNIPTREDRDRTRLAWMKEHQESGIFFTPWFEKNGIAPPFEGPEVQHGLINVANAILNRGPRVEREKVQQQPFRFEVESKATNFQRQRTEATKYVEQAPAEFQDDLYKLFFTWSQKYPTGPFQKLAEKQFSTLASLHPYTRSSSTPSESTFNSLGLESVVDFDTEGWKQFFPTLMIHMPPCQARWLEEELLNYGNVKMDVDAQILDSIEMDDFLPNGRFSHIHIPRYQYVPPEVLTILGLPLQLSPYAFNSVWRRLYVHRFHAGFEFENVYDLSAHLRGIEDIPWIDLLRSSRIAKTFYFDALDIFQYAEAVRRGFHQLHSLTNRQLYDWYFRPLERLMGLDMPMSTYFKWAISCRDGTDDLITILLKLAGLPVLPLSMTSKFVIEEMSKVRTLKAKDFTHTDPMDSPPALNSIMKLQTAPHRTYDDQSQRDLLQSLGIKASQRPARGPYKEDHTSQLADIDLQIREAIDAKNQAYRLLKRVQRSIPDQSYATPDHSTAIMNHEATCKKKASYLQRLWDDYSTVLDRQAGAQYIQRQHEDTVAMINDLGKLPIDQIEEKLTLWRTHRTDTLKEQHHLNTMLTGFQPSSANDAIETDPGDLEHRQSILRRKAALHVRCLDLEKKLKAAEEHLQLRNKGGQWSDSINHDILKDLSQPPPPLPRQPDFRIPDPRILPSPPSDSPPSTSSSSHNLRQPRSEIGGHLSRGRSPQMASKPRHVSMSTSNSTSSLGGVSHNASTTSSSQPQAPVGTRPASKNRSPLDDQVIPTKVTYWDGRNQLHAPKWAKQRTSIALITLKNIFHTQDDLRMTSNANLSKRLPVNGVNANSMLEISAAKPMDDFAFISNVTFRQSADDKTSYLQTKQSLHLSAEIYENICRYLRQLEEHTFEPTANDSNKSFAVLWRTEIKPRSTATNKPAVIQLQLVNMPGAAGNERLVRIHRNDNGKTQVIQFPWVHLPQALKLMVNLSQELREHDDAAMARRKQHEQDCLEDERRPPGQRQQQRQYPDHRPNNWN